MARATQPADEHDLEAIERTFAVAPREDLLRTGEGSAMDFLDATLARPPKLSEPPVNLAKTGETPMADLQASGERDALEEEVIIADDLAEMIDVGDEDEPEMDEASLPDESPEDKPKRTVPPPIPRG
jgi:hypothetical protein